MPRTPYLIIDCDSLRGRSLETEPRKAGALPLPCISHHAEAALKDILRGLR
jgi:hypothetical protein